MRAFSQILTRLFFLLAAFAIFIAISVVFWFRQSNSDLQPSPSPQPEIQLSEFEHNDVISVPEEWQTVTFNDQPFQMRIPADAQVVTSDPMPQTSVWNVLDASNSAVLRVSFASDPEVMSEIMDSIPMGEAWVVDLANNRWVVVERLNHGEWADTAMATLRSR